MIRSTSFARGRLSDNCGAAPRPRRAEKRCLALERPGFVGSHAGFFEVSIYVAPMIEQVNDVLIQRSGMNHLTNLSKDELETPIRLVLEDLVLQDAAELFGGKSDAGAHAKFAERGLALSYECHTSRSLAKRIPVFPHLLPCRPLSIRIMSLSRP